MGREIRMVPPGWEHPIKEDGSFQPMYDECYDTACEKWYSEASKNKGRISVNGKAYWYHDYEGSPPTEEYYRKENWSVEEATNIQVYETVSEGTPVSPSFSTKEELVDYLVEHGDFWDQKRRKTPSPYGMPCEPWKRENAEHFVGSGFALSGIISVGKIYGPSTQGEILHD